MTDLLRDILFEENLTNDQIKNLFAWAEALRSGKYKQTNGQLHRHFTDMVRGVAEPRDAYCCLGVYCEVVPLPAPYTWGNNPYKENERAIRTNDPAVWAGGSFTTRLARMLGIKTYWFIALNDSCHASFSDIADLIEAALGKDVSVNQRYLMLMNARLV